MRERFLNTNTLLHLSDLHFGGDWDATEQAKRESVLSGILEMLPDLEPSWQPQFIIISGDIAWRGSSEDFEKAEKWISKLLNVTDLSYQDVFLCPGNHDIDRKISASYARPTTPDEADEVLRAPVAEHYERAFKEFSDFCSRNNIPKYQFGDHESHLVGVREQYGVRFVSVNSSWFCKDNSDKGKLWVGLEHLRFMEGTSQLPIVANKHGSKTTICLMHHPKEWLHECEQHSFGTRPNTFDFIAKRCHLLLTGHTHGELRDADRIAQSAWQFTAGAAFDNASHFNSFKLIRLQNAGVEYRSFEFDPRAASSPWKEMEVEQAHLPFSVAPAQIVSETVGPAIAATLRTAAMIDAKEIIYSKSRQIRPEGNLPDLVELRVRTQATRQHLSYEEGRLDTLEKGFVTTSFEEACNLSRKTILLGDLGSGKSSIVAQYVLTQNGRESGALCLLVPCKLLRLESNFRLTELIDAFSLHVQEQVAPNVEDIDLKLLLNAGLEVVLVFDGLDELAPRTVGHFVRQLAKLAGNWPNVKIVATGRPVELLGVSYATWQVCEVCRLEEEESLSILRNEFISQGDASCEAERKAAECNSTLKNYPGLRDVTVTPLALRLIIDKLHTLDGSEQPTLGDLLYTLAEERISLWECREGRRGRYDQFISCFPTSFEAMQVLGRVALMSMVYESTFTKEACTQLIADYVGGDKKFVVAEEAFNLFCDAGLLANEAVVEFVFEPLKQVCAGAELFAKWSDDSSVSTYELSGIPWRVAAFAATIARRRDKLAGIQKSLRDCLRLLLHSALGVAPACYVVNEAKDPELAQFAVGLFDQLEARPLCWNSKEEEASSSKAIASTIVLAGDTGFRWLYERYLNPRIPIMHRGSAVISDVFRNWVAMVKDSLTDEQRQTLSVMANPYRAFDGMLMFLDKIVFLCPDQFTNEERLWFFAKHLGSADFGDHAKKELVKAFAGNGKHQVNSILISQAKDSLEAALMYLELNDSAVPREIACSIISFSSNRRKQLRITEAVERCVRWYGTEQWTAVLRWCLASDNQERRICANAARLLFEGGERDFEILGPALLDGMHDGLKAYRALEYMEQLVSASPSNNTSRIAEAIAGFSDGITGAYSGWWRILLDNLKDLGDDAPSILVECTRSIGPFLLARNPDIRQKFRLLLKNSTFYNECKGHLWDADPAVRFGVAMLLSVADPEREAEAVYVVIMGRSAIGRIGFHEWEEFFLSLDFGYSVQDYVHSHLEMLASPAREFALSLLVKNGFHLAPKWHDELRNAYLDVGNVPLNALESSQSHPGSRESFERYKEVVRSNVGENARQAAAALLQYHFEDLTLFEEASCWIALSVHNHLNSDGLREVMVRLSDEPEFRQEVVSRGTQVESEFSTTPLLLDVARALSDTRYWRNVVWTVYCNDTNHGIDLDETCHSVFEFAILKTEFQVPIGEAAKSFLDDPRVTKSRFVDRYHWLVLLAASFADVADETLVKALRRSPIHGTASRGLVAILGHIPNDIAEKRGASILPEAPLEPQASKTREDMEAALKASSLESENLSPNTKQVIEDVVFGFEPDDELLESIAANGINGKLIAQFLRYCFRRKQSLTDRVAVIRSSFATVDQASDKTRNGLARMQNVALRSDLVGSQATRDTYLFELHRALLGENGWSHPIVYEILRIAGKLEPGYVESALCDFALNQGTFHPYLAAVLVDWLSGDLQGNYRDAVVSGARKAILALDQVPWKEDHSSQSPYPFLILPLVVWRFDGNEDDADSRVFVRGLRRLFSNTSGSQRGFLGPLELIEPLLGNVPKERLRRALIKAEDYPDVLVRALVQLIRSLASL